MFWRFGFHTASGIDALLDEDNVALESILDEDDLLQECKAQNTRLIDYFQRTEVLHKLLGYVTGDIEGEEKGRFKYPYVATEVLCSEIWSIVETCVANADQLLRPFWESVLDTNPDELVTKSVLAGHFTKINACFLGKKPEEMLAFIKAQPNIVERILRHIESPTIADLLFRIIQLEDQPGGAGVIEWLSSEQLIPRLVALLSPSYTPDLHSVVADFIKSIVVMSSPSPGSFPGSPSDGQNGPSTNRFSRELVSGKTMHTFVQFMLDDVPFGEEPMSEIRIDDPQPLTVPLPEDRPDSRNSSSSSSSSDHVTSSQATSEPEPYTSAPSLPNAESATSSVVNIISVIIELIRKNNTDYSEPYLFHTLRNRLIQIQQHLPQLLHIPEHIDQAKRIEMERQALEDAMSELVDQMGIVHLGPMLTILTARLHDFQELLRRPRSLKGPVTNTVGTIIPLTFERFRVCELYSELLHCSNMSLMSRQPGYGPVYDEQGRLQGGLSALEELARVIANGGTPREEEDRDVGASGVADSRELPMSIDSTDCSSIMSDEDDEDYASSTGDEEDLADSSDPERIDNPTRTEANGISSTPPPLALPPPEPITISSPVVAPASPPLAIGSDDPDLALRTPLPPSLPDDPFIDPSSIPSSPVSDPHPLQNSDASTSLENSTPSPDSILNSANVPPEPLQPGDQLKKRFLDLGVLSTLLNLFFDFPWNNFLHNTVYDLLHQILSGRTDGGLNRDLTISLFRDARLMHRILEAQRKNDDVSSGPRGVRIGYMGHVTHITEDVVSAFSHYPLELATILAAFAPQPDWDQYVRGEYRQTRNKDNSQLGGGKPQVFRSPAAGPVASVFGRVDEADKGEFATKALGATAVSESTSNGPVTSRREPSLGPEEPEPGIAIYRSSSSSGDSDDDDDDPGWLSDPGFRSAGDFGFRASPLDPPHTRARSGSFGDVFTPGAGVVTFNHSFNADSDEEDSALSPFSDAARTNFAADLSSDFSFPQSSDAFGEDDDGFGDFQGAVLEIGVNTASEQAEGETTPRAKRTWSFEDDFGVQKAEDDEDDALLEEKLREAQLTDNGSLQFAASQKTETDVPP